ncbi:phytanoyl-CoA dioxygenase family protein [uncultured Sphingomonas sp.]|uniref:phytanoyl-CoA dioxygenase family protein n=1 Tax=uncultured Sphingomonas sp. TaxID=158754 RepID=UPI0034436FC6
MKQALVEQGFTLWPGRLDAAALAELERLFDAMPADRPGLRIAPDDAARLSACRAIRDDVLHLIGSAARPVRALLFDKRDASNWALGWHQDRTIEVAERLDIPGYGPWTVKQGRLHVSPPIDVLETMLTVRLHLDPVGPDNAPLEVAPGSHRWGLSPKTQFLTSLPVAAPRRASQRRAVSGSTPRPFCTRRRAARPAFAVACCSWTLPRSICPAACAGPPIMLEGRGALA